MDKPWIVCWHKEANKSHSYLAYSSIELATDVYEKLGAKGYEVSIAGIFESNVYDTHPNFKPKKATKIPEDDRSIFELMGEMKDLADDIFEQGKSTADFLKEEAAKKN